MKFSWKLCFSTLLLTMILFGAGGYVLLSALFQSTYQRELANGAEENRMMQYSLVACWNTSVQDYQITKENVEKTAKEMLRNRKEARIRISDQNKKVLFDNTGSPKDQGLLSQVTKTSRGSRLRRTEDGYELQTAGMIRLEEEEFLYLETIRDVTGIFEERQKQYGIYRSWMIGLMLLEGVCCYAMALWLLRPLKHLSGAAGKLAKGDFSVRVDEERKDEFGEVGAAFNRMTDSLQRQMQELEDAAKRQEDFIGSFAHELKTPLTSIIGYADMLRSQEMDQEERFQSANYIFKEGKRLESLSLKLLELLVVKNSELKKKPIRTSWLREDIAGMLRPMTENSELILKTDVEDAFIFAEPDLLKTVLLNLLDNGRKAIEGNGVLKLSGRKVSGGYAFCVSDTGKGIPEEELSRITEAFYMIDKSRARKQGGAGLGLSLCAEIVKRHGGTLEFESTETVGTAVRLFLPEEEL